MFKFILIISIFSLSNLSIAKSKDWANAIYSNVRLTKTEGGLIGWRLQIIHSNKKNYILLQEFAGEPLAPCLVEAEIQTNIIKFKLPDNCASNGIIFGKIRDRKILLIFPSGKKTCGEEMETLLLIN